MITMLSIISDEETNYIYGCSFHAYAYHACDLYSNVIWKLKGADHTCDCIFLCSNMQIEGLIRGGYLVGSTYMGAYTLFSTTSLNIKKHGSGFGGGLITMNYIP